MLKRCGTARHFHNKRSDVRGGGDSDVSNKNGNHEPAIMNGNRERHRTQVSIIRTEIVNGNRERHRTQVSIIRREIVNGNRERQS